MSYIVVYQKVDGTSGVEECGDLDLAVVTAERLRNVDAVERPRIFKTEEIHYDFRPYYRVEVAGDSDPILETSDRPSASSLSESTASSLSGSSASVPSIPEMPTPFDTPTPVEEIAAVETSSPVDALTTEPIDLPAPIEAVDPIEEVAAVDKTATISDSNPFSSVESVPPPPSADAATTPADTAGGLFGRTGAADIADTVESEVSETVEEAGDEIDRPRRGLFGR